MVNKLNPEQSLLLIIDIQEKLVNMLDKKTVADKAKILAKTASLLKLPTIVTEQYPQGLGSTIESLKDNLANDTKYYEKSTFSACGNEEIFNSIKKSEKNKLLYAE